MKKAQRSPEQKEQQLPGAGMGRQASVAGAGQ